MKTKKQEIVTTVLNKAKSLSSETLTVKQQNGLKDFVENRLNTHGRYGYMFQVVADYQRQLIPANETKAIATYALNNSFIKTV